MADYPCKTCTRVKDPENCENKLCREWQAWFVERWEAMRAAAQISTNDNRCISCGEIIPEGRMMCPNCERSAEDGK